METTHPFAPETCRRERLRFAFMHGKGGKRPGFTDSTGEYRDTRTGWLGREDSNLRLPESKSGALPLGYAPPWNMLARNCLLSLVFSRITLTRGNIPKPCYS